MSRPRIVLVCDWFMKDTAHLAPELAAAGLEVRIVCTYHANEFADALERAQALAPVTAAGIQIDHIPRDIRDGRSYLRTLQIRREIRRWRPNAAYVHINSDIRLFALTRGIPVVLNVHDPVPHPGHPELRRHRRLITKAWHRTARVVTVHGEALRAEVRRLLPNRTPVEHVPLGVVPQAVPYPIPEAQAILLFGRLQPYKGLEVLLEAMQRVWAARPDVRLVIEGSGPSAELIPTDARIDACVRYVPEAEVGALFRRATLLVLPYIQASQSGPGGKALERGIPIVVTDVGALPELVPSRSYVVPPNAPDDLADAVIRHLDHNDGVRRDLLSWTTATLGWPVAARRLIEIMVHHELLPPQALPPA